MQGFLSNNQTQRGNGRNYHSLREAPQEKWKKTNDEGLTTERRRTAENEGAPTLWNTTVQADIG